MFRTIVDCGGLSAAQVELGISLPTISLYLSQLEERLGMTLCRRGRGGFALTPEGHIVHQACLKLGNALGDFRSEVDLAREQSTGELNLAIIDSTATDPNSPLASVIQGFQTVASQAQIRLYVLPPKEIEHRVIAGHVHVGIGKFYNDLPELMYQNLYTETMGLYCARGHPLFDDAETITQFESLTAATYVSRGYIADNEMPEDMAVLPQGPIAYQIEGIALLVLSGRYIGYLPTHYAQLWESTGRMRRILPKTASIYNQITAITRRNLEMTSVIHTFMTYLQPYTQKAGGKH